MQNDKLGIGDSVEILLNGIPVYNSRQRTRTLNDYIKRVEELESSSPKTPTAAEIEKQFDKTVLSNFDKTLQRVVDKDPGK